MVAKGRGLGRDGVEVSGAESDKIEQLTFPLHFPDKP